MTPSIVRLSARRQRSPLSAPAKMSVSDTARTAWRTVLLATVLWVGACSEEVIEPVEGVRPVKIQEIGTLDEEMKREYPGSIRAYQHADMGFEALDLVADGCRRDVQLLGRLGEAQMPRGGLKSPERIQGR